MGFESTPLEGVWIYTPRVFQDERGYFFESYNEEVFRQQGISTSFVQDNQSFSKKGVLRGLHFQKPPYAQAKLVRVIWGTIWDVVVDLRPSSPTYRKWFGIELSDTNFRQLYIPRGFAHGFVVLSEAAIVAYKTDNFYHPEADGGIRYDDPEVGITWPVAIDESLLSPKDRKLPFLREIGDVFGGER
ncbi:MAG: dTDP-4-dehydrorhamnose 3,5-epimerase [Brevinematales bacterium]|nr:dTDP-4-dehydrorhamnose 3,5-epimerase [Brevinematales bacterium]